MSTGLTTTSPVHLPVLLLMFRSVHSVSFALLSLAVIRFLLLESSALLMDIVACCIPPHCPSYFSFFIMRISMHISMSPPCPNGSRGMQAIEDVTSGGRRRVPHQAVCMTSVFGESPNQDHAC
ncbi:hypothetical protein K466DRAFT_257511 [Polyporus arcularius HHB13444]|uniref:Uncharacterized protein n=1 Tax=Polyporus arcularius HHB13444 TaxID=1314778 RepID=A0A5C3P1M9_9APHY|nr:hypothetical protein K466DRAFT_257511 [Polyporus arcularius HHB13444]